MRIAKDVSNFVQVLNNMQLLKDEYLKFINLLSYPVLIVDDNYVSQLANKKFMSLHKISTKTETKLEDAIIDESMVEDEKYILEKKNKKMFFKLLSSQLLFKSKKFYLISLFDISKEHKEQEEILFKKRMFEKLSEHLPEGIMVCEDKINYSNLIFEKLSGYSAKELLSKKFVDLLEDYSKELFNENTKKLLLQKKSYTEQELQLLSKKKKTIWIRIKTSLIIVADKTYFLNVITDISKEKLKYEKLSNLAYYDALTGIYNRRRFNELFLNEYERAKRYKRDLCAIFFDIDHFKKINDTYGHDVGDIILQELSTLVQKHVRETDFFARWGGEEFIILLPETNKENALILAEHIRKNIVEKTFTKAKKITVSFGVTQLMNQEQQKSFLKRLDNALYKAKQEGRNRSVCL